MNGVADHLLNVHLLGLATAFGVGNDQNNRSVLLGFDCNAFVAANFGKGRKVHKARIHRQYGDGGIHTIPLVGQGPFSGLDIFRLQLDLAVRTIEGVGKRFFIA